MYLLSHLFTCFLFPYKAIWSLSVFLIIIIYCLMPFLILMVCHLLNRFPIFPTQLAFQPEETVDCIFPSVSEHKGIASIAFISLITAHDRLFWTAFLLVS